MTEQEAREISKTYITRWIKKQYLQLLGEIKDDIIEVEAETTTMAESFEATYAYIRGFTTAWVIMNFNVHSKDVKEVVTDDLTQEGFSWYQGAPL